MQNMEARQNMRAPLQLLAAPLLLQLLLPAAATAGKLGLCCMGCNATQYSPLGKVSSWAYRYSLWVDDPGAARWLADNRVEFVPHLAHHRVPLPWGGACEFSSDPEGAAAPLCTDAMLDKAVAFAKGQGVKVKHLMGWNEAYDKGNAKATKKYIQPATAAKYWRTHVQGLATRNNLTLVSPTTGVEKNKLAWLGDMLLACWAQRAQGCDVETIAAFSVHDYKCSEPYWRAAYGTGGTFQTALAAHLANGHGSAGKNWTEYVGARLIWVTETNCNGDTGWPPTAPVSGEEQCARIAGQRATAECGQYGKCGSGSIAAMESMATVARISWWNTWQRDPTNRSKTANAMLVDAAGNLFPPGRALASGLLSTVDC